VWVAALAASIAGCGGEVETSEVQVQQALSGDLMPLPEEARAAGGDVSSQAITSKVYPILLIPAGSSVTPTQQATVRQAMGSIRRWYNRELPTKNVVWEPMQVMAGDQTAAHYLTNNNVWAEMPGELQAKLGWSPWDTGDQRHIALIIGRDLMGWAGGNGYPDGRGLAILGMESLVETSRCSTEWWCTPEIWHGTVIHELGHAFSLPHDSDGNSIMSFHSDYKNKHLVRDHASIVDASPATALKYANWAACGGDYQCGTLRCGGNYGNQLQCLPSSLYPKQAQNIPLGYLCRSHSECQSGRCELNADGYKTCRDAPQPVYVDSYFPDSCGTGATGWTWYQSQSSSMYHQIGRPDGYDWSARVDLDGPGYLIYGPYDAKYGEGRHTAWYYLMIDNNTANNDVVATIDVVTNGGGRVLARRDIRRQEFTAANQWQWFSFDFFDACFGNVETRLFWTDRAYLKIGGVYIQR
jgi:hypothetical protein